MARCVCVCVGVGVGVGVCVWMSVVRVLHVSAWIVDECQCIHVSGPWVYLFLCASYVHMHTHYG